MDPRSLSDQDLLKLIIGSRATTKKYHGRLAPLMLNEGDSYPTPKLAAAVELTKRLLRERLDRGPPLGSPREVLEYLTAHFIGREYESFVVLFLDTRHRVVDIEEMFRGTIDSAQVHPREVVRAVLRLNAAACIFAHNHPSGLAEPSGADLTLTKKLQAALASVEVRVLDHFVIGRDESVSFAERGML